MARPLTKVRGNGTPYARLPPIEAEIDFALTEPVATLEGRTRRERSSSDYLRSEVLVHIIREARRRNDNPAMNILVPALIARCEAKLRNKTSDDHIVDAVLGRIAEMIAGDGDGPNPNELDFFEVRFNQAFKALRLTIQRPASRRRRIVQVPAVPVATPGFEEGETPNSWGASLNMSESFVGREQLLGAIQELPERIRQAVVLVHGLGYKIESTDRSEETAATKCGVSGRTIRNYLAQAEERLKSFKEEP